MPDQRNIILAIALSLAVIVGWSLLFPAKPPRPQPGTPVSEAAKAPVPSAPAAAALLTREQAIAAAPRVPIAASRVCGSISLAGARIDDLLLADYFVRPPKSPDAKDRTACTEPTIDAKGAPNPHVTLLSPRGTKEAYYAEFGWIAPPGSPITVPGPDTAWSVESGTALAENAPVTLRWTNPQGVTFRLTYAIDSNYLITATQEIANLSPAPVSAAPYARIVRQPIPAGDTFWVQHEGFIGYVGGDLRERTWKNVLKTQREGWRSTGGWIGLTDKYWLTALAPPQSETFDAQSELVPLPAGNGTTAAFELGVKSVAPGTAVRSDTHFYAGAREVHVVDTYHEALGIKKFDLAIDWGTFLWVVTKPLYFLLDVFYRWVGNFGVAILLVTVVVKLLFFPLANRSFVTMAKMKKLQPMMKEFQERYKDDRVELQKQMMTLYQKEKVNPLAGCLPILLQIPVFFALYKVIFTTIEMRHQPFVGWINDLSARDPTQLVNLFGLFDFQLPDPMAWGFFGFIISAITVGVWPILMGLMMWLQTALNPAPPDKTQQFVFAMMPVLFTVMLASFPAGLVIYYTWNNLLSIIQQYVIMRRLGTPLDLAKALGIKRVARLFSALRPQTPGEPKGGTG